MLILLNLNTRRTWLTPFFLVILTLAYMIVLILMTSYIHTEVFLGTLFRIMPMQPLIMTLLTLITATIPLLALSYYR